MALSDTPQSIGLLWTGDRPVTETCNGQRTTPIRDFHALGGIRTHYPSKRTAAEPRLRPLGHCNRLSVYFFFLLISSYFSVCLSVCLYSQLKNRNIVVILVLVIYCFLTNPYTAYVLYTASLVTEAELLRTGLRVLGGGGGGIILEFVWG